MGDASKDIQDLQRACISLQEAQRTLLLASVTADGFPEISYAPYTRVEGRFYIYVSRLARHSRNLLAQPYASVMFIRNEAESRNLFARERLTYRCTVSEVVRGSAEYEPLLDQLEAAQGQTVALLRTLPDFRLIRLSPLSGSYVVGFGQAYAVDPETGTLQPIDPERLPPR